MKRSLSLGLFLIFFLFTSRLFAGTVQEMGLPSPVAGEWLFANVTAGVAGGTEFEFCLDFVNHTDRPGYAEFDVFLSSGEPLLLENSEGDPFTASLPVFVSPDSEQTRCLTREGFVTGTGGRVPVPPNLRLPEPSIQGWGEVKLSGELSVAGTLRTRSPETGTIRTEVSIPGTESPLRRLRFQVPSQVLFGLSIVNPFNEELEVVLSYGIGTGSLPDEVPLEVVERLSLLPRSQINLLFQDPSVNARFVELRAVGSGGGYSAAYLAIGTGSPIGLSRPADFAYNSGDQIFARETEGTWNLPVKLKDSLMLGEKWIGTTPFGFYVREPGGALKVLQRAGVQSLHQETGPPLAIVVDETGSHLIFPEEDRMMFLPLPGHNSIDRSTSAMTLDASHLEVALERTMPVGLTYFKYCRAVLVDTQALSVLELFSYLPSFQSGCNEPPPWR